MIRMLMMITLATGLLVGCGSEEPQAEKPEAPSYEPDVDQPLGGPDLSNWKFSGYTNRNHWQIGTAKLDPDDPKKLIVESGGTDLVSAGIVGANIHTKEAYGDAHVELDVMIPAESNSGIFLMGEYEIQVLDDPGADAASPSDMDNGAVVGVSPPKTLVQLEPGTWHHFEIYYRAPRFDGDGNKTEPAEVTSVAIDGQVVQEGVVVNDVTPSNLTGEQSPRGPLMLQGAEGPVAFRNIKITPMN